MPALIAALRAISRARSSGVPLGASTVSGISEMTRSSSCSTFRSGSSLGSGSVALGITLLLHARSRPTKVLLGGHAAREEQMNKPRIFLGSSAQQQKLLQALTRGLDDVAQVEPWTTSFNPGTTTLERLLELTREVDFAAFLFAGDDWTAKSPPSSDSAASGQASPRDNVVFEAGLFGGVLGMRRTFILHARGSKLPSDLLGLTSVRYDEAAAADTKAICQKLR